MSPLLVTQETNFFVGTNILFENGYLYPQVQIVGRRRCFPSLLTAEKVSQYETIENLKSEDERTGYDSEF